MRIRPTVCFGLALLVATPAMAFAGPVENQLGYESIQSGKWAEAEAALRAGLAEEPNDPMRLLNLAYVLKSTGRATEAADVYKQVLALNRDPLVAVGSDSNVRPMRAKILAKKGIATLATAK